MTTYESLIAALTKLSAARKEHPGLERIGNVMPHVDDVVSIFDLLVEEQMHEVEEPIKEAIVEQAPVDVAKPVLVEPPPVEEKHPIFPDDHDHVGAI